MDPLLASLEEERRRRYRRVVAFSAAAHVGAFLVFVVLPMPRHTTSLPAVVQVDLVAGPAPVRRRPAHHAARPKPKAAPRPKAEAKPAPPKPPPPKQAEVVLPEKPRQAPKPKPPPPKVEKTAKAEKPEKKKPEPKPAEQPEKPPKEISYDALMAKLRKEDHDELPSQPAAEGAPSEGQAQRGGGAVVTPEVMEWMRRAKAQVTQSWVLAPGFRTQQLQTQIDVTLGANGQVVATKVTQGSGNPWFDQSVERAIEKASPLPPPPGAGDWLFVFRPGDAF